MPYEYRPARPEELERIWEKNIAAHSGDPRWPRWRQEALENNASGRSLTFLVIYDGDPIGEGTLLFSPDCSAIEQRTVLCDWETVANVNALRIEKAHEGQGHISRLMREMEAYARDRGFLALTIGVDAKEARNLAIYLHWGYTEFILSETEDGELVLYYRKEL